MNSETITKFWQTKLEYTDGIESKETYEQNAVTEFFRKSCNIFKLKKHLDSLGTKYKFFIQAEDGKWKLNKDYFLYKIKNIPYKIDKKKYNLIPDKNALNSIGIKINTDFPFRSLYDTYGDQVIEDPSFIETFEILLLDRLFMTIIYNAHQAYRTDGKPVNNSFRFCEVINDNTMMSIVNPGYFRPRADFDEMCSFPDSKHMTWGEYNVIQLKKLKETRVRYIEALRDACGTDFSEEISQLEQMNCRKFCLDIIDDYRYFDKTESKSESEFKELVNEFLSIKDKNSNEIFEDYKPRFQSKIDPYKEFHSIIGKQTNYNQLVFCMKKYLLSSDLKFDIEDVMFINEFVDEKVLEKLKTSDFVTDIIQLCNEQEHDVDRKFKKFMDIKFFYTQTDSVAYSGKFNEFDFLGDCGLFRTWDSFIYNDNGKRVFFRPISDNNTRPTERCSKNDQNIKFLEEKLGLKPLSSLKTELRKSSPLFWYMTIAVVVLLLIAIIKIKFFTDKDKSE